MTSEELADKLKDIAHDLDLSSLRAVRPSGPGKWTIVTVSHAGIFSEAPDGWDTEIRESEI